MLNRVTLPLQNEILRSGERSLGDPVAQIRASFLAALAATVRDPQARRVFEIALFKVEHGPALREVRERRLNGLRSRVGQLERGFRRAARHAGGGAALPARAAALGMQALVDGLITNWLLDPEAFDLERVGRQTIDAYLRGVRDG
jgi:TetR/AcrR family acrAB operon transcriptional repressor